MQLLSFCAFELCVGIFWPSMMSMRANYVPEELRATIINIFRIPLNAFVCVVLGNVSGTGGIGTHSRSNCHLSQRLPNSQRRPVLSQQLPVVSGHGFELL